jgi:ribosomal protein S18 acetylase RimI-like enzyme
MQFKLLTRIEEAALNAWPAPRQMLYDGWVLRFTGGNSKRVNSVNIFGPSTLPLGEKIQFCEAVHNRLGLPVLFRLSEPFTSPELRQVLAEKGYEPFDPTLVLGKEIDARVAVPDGVVVRTFSDEDWLQIYARITGKTLASLVHHKAVLKGIVPEKNLIAVYLGDRPVACGMGVLVGDLLGYFSIYTDKLVRRQGLGQAVMRTLSQWGFERGATFGYLQVEGDNAPARSMYQKLGFVRLYRYEYWKKIENANI